MSSPSSSHAERLDAVRQRIAAAAHRAGRDPAAIDLIAVSKRKPVADIRAAYAAGVRHFGENRADELEAKAQALADLADIRWHFIGHLQTRQSLAVARYADCFHAVDRLRIAERLSHQLVELDRRLPVFLQVNISGEATKGGFDVLDWERDQVELKSLCDALRQVAALPRLEPIGLMTMAPFAAEPTELARLFERMARLGERVADLLPGRDTCALSMGMTQDYELAVESGATHVRIGTAIFGPRDA
jgi:pyridoxal phosphate enzyme (YggS family)